MSLTDQNRLADFILQTTNPMINRLDINPVLRRILARNLSSLDSSVSKSHRRPKILACALPLTKLHLDELVV